MESSFSRQRDLGNLDQQQIQDQWQQCKRSSEKTVRRGRSSLCSFCVLSSSGKTAMLVCETKHGTASRVWGSGGVSSWCPDPAGMQSQFQLTTSVEDSVQQTNSGGSQGGIAPRQQSAELPNSSKHIFREILFALQLVSGAARGCILLNLNGVRQKKSGKSPIQSAERAFTGSG